MSELKQQLETLRIDRRPERRRGAGWRVLLVLAVVVLAGFGIWLSFFRPTVYRVEVVRPSVLATLGAEQALPQLTASGYVVARREAVVSAKIQGRLAELNVEEGDRVDAGQVIARLESEDYRAAIRRAEAALERAAATIRRAEADLAEYRRQLRKASTLAAEGVVPEDEAEAAGSRVQVAEAALAQARGEQAVAAAELEVARADFRNTLIRAPFAGTVVKKMAEVGESVAPIPPGVNISTASGAIVALADLQTLEVEADVAEAQVARLGEGQPARVTVEAFAERSFRGAVRQIIPTADRTKATVLVRVTILVADPRLKPEMSARVDFLSEDDAAPSEAGPFVTVPNEVLTERDGRSVAFAVDAGHARVVALELGRAVRGGVVVLRGLSGSEQLILAPPAGLTDGAAVRVR